MQAAVATAGRSIHVFCLSHGGVNTIPFRLFYAKSVQEGRDLFAPLEISAPVKARITKFDW